MGRCSATTFLSAGNITHTPAVRNLIALGIPDAVRQRVSQSRSQRRRCELDRPYRASPSAGAAPRSATHARPVNAGSSRARPMPACRQRQGRMHTSPCTLKTSTRAATAASSAASIGDLHRPRRARRDGPRRKIAARHRIRSLAPQVELARRWDGQTTTYSFPDRIFLMDVTPEPMASWLFWRSGHLAQGGVHARWRRVHARDGPGRDEPTIEYLIDLVVDADRWAAGPPPSSIPNTPEGIASRARPFRGSIAMQKGAAHGRDPENSALLVVAPSTRTWRHRGRSRLGKNV
jgi:4-hydroxyphenylacetate 3-monooxygenase